MKVINGFLLESDFWENNPSLWIAFKPLFKKKTSANSKYMHAASLLEHPDSSYDNWDYATTLKLIKDNYYPDFDPTKYPEAIELFNQLCVSKPKKFLKQWEKKWEQRNEFMDSLDYDENTYELLDKMMSATDKMWKQYMSALKSVEDEDTAKGMGGAQESLGEQGHI